MINFSLFLEQIQLNELGNSPYNWTINNSAGDYIYQFQSKSGLIRATFTHAIDKFYYFVFADENGNTDRTNSGDEFKIMSTINSILKDFIEKVSPTAVVFSSDKDNNSSRFKLYSRGVKRLFKTGLNDYELHMDQTQDGLASFGIVKKKKRR